MFSPGTVALTSISITLSKRHIKSEKKKRFDVSRNFFFRTQTRTHTPVNKRSPSRWATAVHEFTVGLVKWKTEYTMSEGNDKPCVESSTRNFDSCSRIGLFPGKKDI